ncbi:heterokaryon incompatibility protein-domain-containing protein [Phaeosphaeriaceae sp. PMI808]|nr:heterokaryon incompatibility protein-domain-containing protein [Phaeosphaeriaceae sp. PMI808]
MSLAVGYVDDKKCAWVLTIQTANLDETNLEYDALSYVWGATKDTYPIVCNEQSLRVHENLYSALPFLALRTGKMTVRPLWVDAICLNQGDEDEKEVQIRLMNIIYRKAKQVWVWLGCAPPEVQAHIPQAISLFPDIIQELKRQSFYPSLWKKHEVQAPLRSLKRVVWRAFLHLVNNPWFSRVWVLQEAALAREIMFLCGTNRFEYAPIENLGKTNSFRNWNILDINGDRVDLRLNCGLRVVVDIRSLCNERVDRVFGLLGLVDKQILSSRVKFHTSTSTTLLYTQFSAYILLNADPKPARLWWLFFNHAFNQKKQDCLPSLVFDLHCHDLSNVGGQAMPPIDYLCLPGNYEASGKSTAARQGLCPSEIILRGRIVDKIVLISPECPSQRQDETQFSYLFRLAQWEEGIAEKILNVEGGNCKGPRNTPLEQLRVPEEIYWRTLFATHYLRPPTEFDIPIETTHLYRKVIGTITRNFRSRNWKRRFGFCSNAVQIGDVVCVFDGATTPHILRKVSNRDGTVYRAISDAYVESLMVKEADGLDVEVQDITLI